MKLKTTAAILAALTFGVGFTACKGGDHNDNDGHTHNDGDEHANGDEHDHDMSNATMIGEFEHKGSKFKVRQANLPAAGGTLDCDLVCEGEVKPDSAESTYGWAGSEDGTEISQRKQSHGHGENEFHMDGMRLPAELPEAMWFWVEFKLGEETVKKSFPVKMKE